MPLFSYTAKNQDGNIVRGTIDAVSLEAAKSALEEMNLIPEEIHEATVSEKKAPEESPVDTSLDSLEKRLESETQPLQLKEESETGHEEKPKRIYFPIVDTFRLYAGWLLAGYFVAYILGIYQLTKPLPFEIPYVFAFLYSPLIFSFALAAFLFLLATNIQKRVHGGMLSGFVITLVAVGAFVVYRINT